MCLTSFGLSLTLMIYIARIADRNCARFFVASL
jgi:hypothetical protein